MVEHLTRIEMMTRIRILSVEVFQARRITYPALGTPWGLPIRRWIVSCEKKALDIGFVENRKDKWNDEWMDGFVV